MSVNVAAIYKEFVQELLPIYDPSEAESIVNALFEDAYYISRVQRLTNLQLQFSNEQIQQLNTQLELLKNHVPVQHLIGFSWFCGMQFLVNTFTLIPRPETEELVYLIKNENSNQPHLRILDIGTGTGCIPIVLSSLMKESDVFGWDISEGALHMAIQNAERHQANVTFQKVDILKEEITETYDIIVSNPPYIPETEKQTLHQNVSEHEPSLALFVPDHDPLLFYRIIADKASKALVTGGKLYFEIHENFGSETVSMLKTRGFESIEIYQDLNGKDRMIRAINPPRG